MARIISKVMKKKHDAVIPSDTVTEMRRLKALEL